MQIITPGLNDYSDIKDILNILRGNPAKSEQLTQTRQNIKKKICNVSAVA